MKDTPANSCQNYGWQSTLPPESCGYIAPTILNILKGYSVSRILDIGSGNGSLAAILDSSGYYVAGVEYDLEGINLSKKQYPHLNFYNAGVEDSPNIILESLGVHSPPLCGVKYRNEPVHTQES